MRNHQRKWISYSFCVGSQHLHHDCGREFRNRQRFLDYRNGHSWHTYINYPYCFNNHPKTKRHSDIYGNGDLPGKQYTSTHHHVGDVDQFRHDRAYPDQRERDRYHQCDCHCGQSDKCHCQLQRGRQQHRNPYDFTMTSLPGSRPASHRTVTVRLYVMLTLAAALTLLS